MSENTNTNNANDTANNAGAEQPNAGQERVVNQTKSKKSMTRGRKALWIGGGVAAAAAIAGGVYLAVRKGNTAPLVAAVQQAGEVAANAAG